MQFHMDTLHLVRTGALLVVVALAAWSDLRTARIPNKLVVTGLAAALLVQSAAGMGPFLGAVEGAGIALLLFLPLFAIGAMGGGDVKLIAVACAFLGTERMLPALLVMALAGGAMALASAWRRGVVLPLVLGSGGLLRHWITPAPLREGEAPLAAGGITIPYGVAIAVGAAAGCFL